MRNFNLRKRITLELIVLGVICAIAWYVVDVRNFSEFINKLRMSDGANNIEMVLSRIEFSARRDTIPRRDCSTIPVLLILDVGPQVGEMRFAESTEAIKLAEWIQPITRARVFVPEASTVIYGEFRPYVGDIVRASAEIQYSVDTLSTQSEECESRQVVSNVTRYDFNYDAQGWRTYGITHDGDNSYNVFTEVAWNPKGGIGGTGYITAQSSEWTIDDPETPDSILALITFAAWDGGRSLDLREKSVTFFLKGDQIDLKGARVYFWVSDREMRTRWHYIAEPLFISEGSWGQQILLQLKNDPSLWHNSWNVPSSGFDPGTLDMALSSADSYGISFVGFPEGEEVTGSLSMDEFIIH